MRDNRIAKAVLALSLVHVFANHVGAETSLNPLAGPLGSKAIQLSIGPDGIKRKDGGYICELKATLGGGQYSEWGETEDDARSLVVEACSKKSGMLLCKRDKATCKEDK